MNRDGPAGRLPIAQILACGRPEANLICMLSVPRAAQSPAASYTSASSTGPAPAAALEAASMFVARAFNVGGGGVTPLLRNTSDIHVEFPWNWMCHVSASAE